MSHSDRRFLLWSCLLAAALSAFGLTAGALATPAMPLWASQAVTAATPPALPATAAAGPAAVVYPLRPLASASAPDVATLPSVRPAVLDSVSVSPPRNQTGTWVAVAIDPVSSVARVRLYDGETLIQTMWGFGGPLNAPTITGMYRITAHLGTIHTTLYRRSLGHEFYLPYFLQFQGDYGFHGYKINDATGAVEATPSHGCIALSNADIMTLNAFARDGTPVFIQYQAFDPGPAPLGQG